MAIPFEIKMTAYGIQDKVVKKTSNSAGNLYLPKEWIGKQVRVVLLEDIDTKEE